MIFSEPLDRFVANRKFSKIEGKEKFSDLSEEDKEAVRLYYVALESNLHRRIRIMSREASIQLVLQNSLILYQYFRFPVIEFNYGPENRGIQERS